VFNGKETATNIGQESSQKEGMKSGVQYIRVWEEALRWGQRERNPTVQQFHRRRGHLRIGIPWTNLKKEVYLQKRGDST
jgi:hypothetical protein